MLDAEPNLASVKESESLEPLKRNFSISELDNWFGGVVTGIVDENPGIGSYGLFSLMIEEMPQRVSHEARQVVSQALASPDSNTSHLGRKVLPFLNARQLLSAVDYCALTDNPEEKEDLLQEAILILAEKASKLGKGGIPGVRSMLTTCAAERYGLPSTLVNTLGSKVLIATIESVLGEEGRGIDINEIEDFASELSQEAGVPKATLRDYLRYRVGRGNTSTAINEVEEVVETRELNELIEATLESLTFRERRVLQLRFGLLGGRVKPLEEVASEIGRSSVRVRQIETHTLRKLRSSDRAKELLDFADLLPDDARYKRALMTKAVTAFHSGDYSQTTVNLRILEDRYTARLSSNERELIDAVRQNKGSYRWDDQKVGEFISWYKKDKKIKIDARAMIRLGEVVDNLRKVWELRSKISKV
ncbi:MAG: sigma-70 family RNA polymerase sigma factor [bacterium]|nr:sigma-70 family RNA polymerase sigma factor [bacterium]